MKAVSVDTVRILIPWVAVQHGKDAYDWSLVDQMVDAAVSNTALDPGHAELATALGGGSREQPVARLPRPVRWRGGRPLPGQDLGVRDMERARCRGILRPAPDPGGFVDLLKAAYPAVKAAEPASIVVTGGLAPIIDFSTITIDSVKFVRAMYAAHAKYSMRWAITRTVRSKPDSPHPARDVGQRRWRQEDLATGTASRQRWWGRRSRPRSQRHAAQVADVALRRPGVRLHACATETRRARIRKTRWDSTGPMAPRAGLRRARVSVQQGSAVAPQLILRG